jgi:hypothetical protein
MLGKMKTMRRDSGHWLLCTRSNPAVSGEEIAGDCTGGAGDCNRLGWIALSRLRPVGPVEVHR